MAKRNKKSNLKDTTAETNDFVESVMSGEILEYKEKVDAWTEEIKKEDEPIEVPEEIEEDIPEFKTARPQFKNPDKQIGVPGQSEPITNTNLCATIKDWLIRENICTENDFI